MKMQQWAFYRYIFPKNDGEKFLQPAGHEAQPPYSRWLQKKKHAPVCGLSAAQNSQRTLMLFSNEQRQSMWAVRATRHRGRHESRKDCATLQVTRNWPLRLVVTENPGNPEKADWVSSASEELQPVLVCQQNKTNIPGMWLFLRPRDEFSDTLSYGMSSLYFSPTALTVAVTFDSMKH